MNVLLVNPWITDFAAYDFWSRPLGLLYVGAFLEMRGHAVRMIDCMDRFQESGGLRLSERAGPYGTGKFHREIIPKPDCLKHVPRHFGRYGIPVELFAEKVRNGPRPDIVLVTCIMTYWYPGAFEAISIIRRLLPGVPVVLGGIYAVLCTGHARSESGADVVVTDPQPSGIVSAVESACGGSGGGDIPPDEFAEWPDPLWDAYSRLPHANAMTSRGCPMNCTVCASKRLFGGFERRDPEETVQAMLALARRGVRDCAFTDDALLLDSGRHALPMFRKLIDAGAPLRLHSPNGLHVREMTPELASAMKRAGMATVRLSLETASPERAGDFSGKVSRDEFRRAVDALFGAGYTPGDIGAYILVGLPGQTMDEVMDTVAFVLDCGVTVKPALFSPVPGTVEFERAVAAGMIRADDDPVLHNNTLRTVDWFENGEEGYREFRREITAANENLIERGAALKT